VEEDMTPPGWEYCPDCGHYYQGTHLCDKSREAVLARVEQKLDLILEALRTQQSLILLTQRPEQAEPSGPWTVVPTNTST